MPSEETQVGKRVRLRENHRTRTWGVARRERSRRVGETLPTAPSTWISTTGARSCSGTTNWRRSLKELRPEATPMEPNGGSSPSGSSPFGKREREKRTA
jgi:hypothetical protein